MKATALPVTEQAHEDSLMTAASLQTSRLLRAVEVWSPTSDGNCLERTSSIYRGAETFAAVSNEAHFDHGQGLPGLVWDAGVPVMFDDLGSRDFLRHEAAREDGLEAGIGVPVFDGEEMVSVLLFLFATTEITSAAFESWILEETRHELMPGTGYYANLDRFRRMTQYLRFPYGAGLPGDVWQARMPRLIDRLANSTDFLRASGADAEGLDFGLAVPVVHGDDAIRAVCVLLSCNASPIAQALQIWTPNEDRSAFEPTSVLSPGVPGMSALMREQSCEIGQGLVGTVWQTRRPLVSSGFEEESNPLAAFAAEHDLTWSAGWPVIAHGEVQAVCVFID